MHNNLFFIFYLKVRISSELRNQQKKSFQYNNADLDLYNCNVLLVRFDETGNTF